MFEAGDFTLASGAKSGFKIECDSLTDSDWAGLAQLIITKGFKQTPYGRQNLGYNFRDVVGVPRGGLKLAEHLKPYATGDMHSPLLIVDDVLTTGGSMEKLKTSIDKTKFPYIIGLVVFARGSCPNWVTPIFTTDWLV